MYVTVMISSAIQNLSFYPSDPHPNKKKINYTIAIHLTGQEYFIGPTSRRFFSFFPLLIHTTTFFLCPCLQNTMYIHDRRRHMFALEPHYPISRADPSDVRISFPLRSLSLPRTSVHFTPLSLYSLHPTQPHLTNPPIYPFLFFMTNNNNNNHSNVIKTLPSPRFIRNRQTLNAKNLKNCLCEDD